MKDCKGGMRMNDIIEKIGKNSIIQHGKENDRVYLMKLDKRDADMVLEQISKLAYDHKYTKLFCKIPKSIAPRFFADGYMMEAYIPHFYNKQEDAFFVSKFLNSDRLLNIEKKQLLNLNALLSDETLKARKSVSKISGYKARRLNESDIDQITQLYKEVFVSYPFPIHNAEYILQTMREDVQYYGVEKENKLVALSSAEMDTKGKNAEMTDFATHPIHHGNNLSGLLLGMMEKEMKEQGILTLYTIARLNSIPMNKTFLRLGYEYSGTLIKNTNIAGQIESMNVYYKHI